MFTWVYIKNWAAVLESFLKSKNLKGFGGGIVTKAAFMSLNTKHIYVCCIKTKMIVIPGLPDLWETLAKKQKGAQSDVSLVSLFYPVSCFLYIKPGHNTLLQYLASRLLVGKPCIKFSECTQFPFFFFFLYSALHLLKINLFNAKQDLERSSY